MSNEDVLLDLTTERRREKIAIDRKLYELAAPQDFELREYMWLSEQGRRIQDLGQGSYEGGKFKQLEYLLDKILCKIVRTRLPRRVMRRLTSAQKLAIVGAFTEAAGIKGETERPKAPDGTSSSPGSSGSTAAAFKAGSPPASAS
jgi:hypothetical protein